MRRFFLALIVFVIVLPSGQAQGIITTIAGTNWVFRGDGGPALSAPLGQPWGVASDAAGNIYASDYEGHIVFKLSSNGILTVVAGNGIKGFSGDGQLAVNAALNGPKGVAVDAAGNVFIVDSVNCRIRRVATNGIITTIAGAGFCAFSGDNSPAISARLYLPNGLAIDAARNLYVADEYNNRIRKIDTAGIITTVAGSGNTTFSGDGGPATLAGLNRPYGVEVDAAGNLYLADTFHSRIRKVSPSGTIATLAGNGNSLFTSFPAGGLPALTTSVGFPQALRLDSQGNLYISSSDRVLRLSGSTLTLVAGRSGGLGSSGFSGDGGSALAAQLNGPIGMAVDPSNTIYLADGGNGRVRRFALGGNINTVAGNGLFKFGGDGGPATSASLRLPRRVVLDAAGNLFVADRDNNRIRKISPTGIITTVAGIAEAGFSGDGGPANAARLDGPAGIALDAAGNLYIADDNNDRIRKVDALGIITTIAGVGGLSLFEDSGQPALNASIDATDVAVDTSGVIYVVESFANRVRKIVNGQVLAFAGVLTITGAFGGDNGPAGSAQLNAPQGVAVDISGNVYIADRNNNRIRKVSSSGVITTFAGNGTAGYSGDGGQATSARLNAPMSVAVDSAGNVYFADQLNARVRKVSAAGIITTVAGNGLTTFTGDGGPATSASLSNPLGAAADAAGNVYVADAYNDRIRKVLSAASSFTVSPASLSMTAAAGAALVTPRQLSVSSAVTGLSFSATASTQSGGAWLSVSPATGNVPGAITVSVNVSTLTPGTYRGTITVLAPQASPTTQVVSVDLTVQAAANPQLSVEPSALTFEAAGSASLRITNAGGGTLNWSLETSTNTGGNWLSASPAGSSVTSTTPATVQVNANSAGLTPGVYSGSLRVNSATTGESMTVGVTLLLAQQSQSIVLSQTGLLFTGVEGGGGGQTQSLGVLNAGQGTMNYSVEASSLSGGNWLSASPTSGSSIANSLEIPLVSVSASPAGLRTGQYSGQVKVSSPTATNSPQLVSVDFNLLPAGSNPGPLVRPTGLIFATRAGSSSPGSQTIRLGTPVANNVEARAGAFTFDGGTWLDGQPRNVLLTSAESKLITVQPVLGSLAPNVYRGALTLLFDDNSPSQVVNVLFVVVPAASTNDLGVEAPCVPQKLLTVHRTLAGNFSSPASWPAVVEAQVVDDCGNAVPNATVLATFSSGDSPLTLASLRTGIYTGTWRPVNAASQVTVTLRAILPPLQPAEATVQGSVTANASAPTLYSQGIVNAASFAQGAELAPGTIISVFGKNMAQTGAASLPIPRTLGGATLTIGGADAPLFYSSDGQINAQIPFELAANARHQAVVKTQKTGGQSITVPETITLAAVRPGIFTTNQQGNGQGAILNTRGALVDVSAAAAAGEVVQVFATGLGATNPVVASGALAPSAEPLARVNAEVTAEIDGKPARVFFAGLAPGFVGLYQVNVEIPGGVTPGPAATLVLRQAGVPSNTVTLAVR